LKAKQTKKTVHSSNRSGNENFVWR